MEKNLINNRLKAYFELVRPFTLLAPLMVSIFIMVASFFYSNQTEFLLNVLTTKIIPAGIILALLNSASNILNQITDLKTDKISKPYRPLPKKIITKKEAIIISTSLYSFSLLLAFTINYLFLIFVVSITVFTVSYSLPPRLKDKLFINQLWVGIPRGLLGILASWSVFSNPFKPLPLTIGFIAMVYLIGGSITKDITDSYADKKTGTRTLINTYGIKQAALMAFPFMVFPFLFVPILVDIKILEPHFFFLTFLSIPTCYIFYLMIKDNSKGKHLENTRSWALMYILYFVFAFSFSILTIAGKIIF